MQSGSGDLQQQQCQEADRLAAMLCPATAGIDPSYLAMRRFLLREKALKGKLTRQSWECNGAGYVAYRRYIQNFKQWDNSRPPTPSSRLEDSAGCASPSYRSADFCNGDSFDYGKGRPSTSSTTSQNASTNFGNNQSISSKEAAYSFVGMHCIFDECKASVNVLKFGHLSSVLLAFAASDGSLTICSIDDPPRILQNLKGHTKEITDFDWSLNNQYICSSSLDKSVRIWDVSSGQCVRVIYEKSAQLCICFNSVNNNLLLVGNGQKEVKVFNFSTGRQLHRLSVEKNITTMDIDNAGHILFAGDAQGCIHSIVVDTHTGALSRAHRNTMGLSHRSPTTTVQFRTFSLLAGGPVLLASNQDGTLRFFSVALEVKGYLSLRCSLHLPPHARNIRASFCPLLSLEKGEFIVSGNEDANVCFYDFTRPRHPCVNRLQGHGLPVVCVSWNHGENLLASSDCGGSVIVWRRAKT
ncbi:hypothetical protein O6H91_13G074200 [Diphasiastrum complanatum]|uniref:Uncharacterized protein n=1 Tax=Diphasiastrum complanatum TaxID=34168 RepID=A0ACC2BW15_DIPCM|nr:hypothetical protein O6H91_13G074200 [Diphasiastrum complanatum]